VIPPEFSRTIKLDRLGEARLPQTLTATPEECTALAKRFDLISVDALDAQLTVWKRDDCVTVEGQFSARLVQACVASGAPVPVSIKEALLIKFRPEAAHEPDAEIELAEDDCDFAEHDGQCIDMGEAVAQSLALTLDPFLRAPNADAILKAAGVKGEGEEAVGAFAGLAALRDKLAS
jgi:uncharacterized metal-binding protein YceD (DUF177 family)